MNSSNQVVIVDYGAGNLRSVARAVAFNGYEPLVSCEAKAVEQAQVLILPGVGAAADTMRNLQQGGLVEPLRKFIASGRPFLGVCMGQQALLSVSEEGGEHACLDVIEGRVKRLPPGQKVPHMGWNQVHQRRPHPVFDGIEDGAYFYFVHSYYPAPAHDSASPASSPATTSSPPSSTPRRAASPASASTPTSSGWPSRASHCRRHLQRLRRLEYRAQPLWWGLGVSPIFFIPNRSEAASMDAKRHP
jgi:glutamine amidotransferase